MGGIWYGYGFGYWFFVKVFLMWGLYNIFLVLLKGVRDFFSYLEFVFG